jgi:hypothetical protein
MIKVLDFQQMTYAFLIKPFLRGWEPFRVNPAYGLEVVAAAFRLRKL